MSRTQHFQLLSANITPGVSQDVLSCRSTGWVFLKKFSKKFARANTQVIWELKFCSAYLLIQLFVVRPFERKFTAKQRVQEHAQCPDISWWPTILNFTNNLWRHITWRSAENFDLPLVGNTSAKSKVNQLYYSLCLIK